MAVSMNAMPVSDDEPLPLRLRSYQLEMYEQSLKGNTIIAMETGSGKTPVAIFRIMHELETSNNGKVLGSGLILLVALCLQQRDAVQNMIPAANIRTIVGVDGPERWSKQSVWDQVLKDVDIVFSTFSILHDALSHAFVRMEDLSLLIFDEVHHCMKKASPNLIMQHFYHNEMARNSPEKRPVILGLTASPSLTGKEQILGKLEANMDAVCRTPKRNRHEMREYVHRPSFERLEFAPLELGDFTSVIDVLSNSESQYLMTTNDAVEIVQKKAIHILQELGLWAAQRFLRDLLEALQDKVKPDRWQPQTSSQCNKDNKLAFLRSLVQLIETTQVSQSVGLHVSTKVQCLIDHLAKVHHPEFAGIVFVKQRVVAAMLEKLLTHHPTTEVFHVGAFVGSSNSVSYEKNITELVVPRTQNSILQEFRLGKKNLIISTDALEEGIDVAACNSVICFDPPQNLKSFIQRRGRARKSGSTYTILVPPVSDISPLEQWQEMEDIIIRQIQDDERVVNSAQQTECLHEPVEYYFSSPVTGALVTADTARQHLSHFCSKLPHQPYTDLIPSFDFEEADDKLIRAKVCLPMSVPHDVRRAWSLRGWRTERAAIKDAAFQAYKALYEFGLLNENLLALDNKPHIDDNFKEQRLHFDYLGRRIYVWDKFSSDKPRNRYYRTLVSVQNDSTGWCGEDLIFWTAVDVAAAGTLSLFVENSQTLTVLLKSSGQVDIADDEVLRLMASCTSVLAMAARSKVLVPSETQFAVFITPSIDISELKAWLQRYSGEVPARELIGAQLSKGLGLVANIAQGKSVYLIHEIHYRQDHLGEQIVELECIPFPKRRNFLKIRASKHASFATDQELDDGNLERAPQTTLHDVNDCVVRLLPVKYAWTSRLLPSIFYQLEMMLTAQNLQELMFSSIPFGSNAELVKSLTAPATALQDNYEKLEFLGDSLLKYHATQQVFCDYPYWHEGHLTRQRNTIVSNPSLANAAVERGLAQYILWEPFTGKKWCPPSLALGEKTETQERHLPLKTLADVVESLLGAAYLGGGLEAARNCMSLLLPQVTAKSPDLSQGVINAPHPVKSATERSSLEMAIHSLAGYAFQQKQLLFEALTHPSCARDAFTEPYQRLEFLGDAVLDMLVVTTVYEMIPDASQGQMTRVKAALVNANFLAFLCFSCCDTVEGTTVRMSITGDMEHKPTTHGRSLWMMMKHDANDAIRQAQDDGNARFESLRSEIVDNFDLGTAYPWEALVKLRAPKFLSDIVESILGAIFIDSGGDLEVCSQFLEKIDLMEYLRRIIRGRIDVTHPQERLQRLLCGRKMEYRWHNDEGESKSFGLDIVVDEIVVATISDSCSTDEAIIRATSAACERLK